MIMVQMVVFINLFFVPVVCLFQLYRKAEKPLVKSMDLLFQYCVVTACNIPAAKALIYLLKKVIGMQVSIDSGYYTLAALISAFFISLLYSFCKIIHIEIEVKKEEESEKEELNQ